MTEAEKIAAGLTEAQRDRFLYGTDLGCIVRSATTRGSLIRKGLAISAGLPNVQALDWTPLGLEVRKVLERQS